MKILFLVPLLILGIPTEVSCREMRTLIVENKAKFYVELANDQSTRARGLMFRESLADCHGMWFDFSDTKMVSMWMKDTAMSLDIFFVSEDLIIEHIIESTLPFSSALLKSEMPVRYALEVTSGAKNSYNIVVGDRIIISKNGHEETDMTFKYSYERSGSAMCAQLKTD